MQRLLWWLFPKRMARRRIANVKERQRGELDVYFTESEGGRWRWAIWRGATLLAASSLDGFSSRAEVEETLGLIRDPDTVIHGHWRPYQREGKDD